MRIRELTLSWFRGAAAEATLPTSDKSMVVFGPNGAGKTSFVDGIEFLLNKGKIDHLSHEYARRLDDAVVNTHAPATATRRVALKTDDGSEVAASIAPGGAPRFSGEEVVAGWSKRRVVLRQDEVSEFVHQSKGDKYSALLPLIGLGPLETVAANVRALAKRFKEEAKLDRLAAELDRMKEDWGRAFPGMDRAAVGEAIKELHLNYLPGETMPGSIGSALAALRPVLEARVAGLTKEHAQHLHITTAHEAGLSECVAEAVLASEKAAALAQPLLEERLAVLKSASAFGSKIQDDDTIACPACGSSVLAADFNAHVAAESARLESATTAFEVRRAAFSRLANAVATAKSALGRPDMDAWRSAPQQVPIAAALAVLAASDADRLREGMPPEDLAQLRDAVLAISRHLADCVRAVPPSVEALVRDQKSIEAASSHPTMRAHTERIGKIRQMMEFLADAEAQVRAEIKDRTEAVIASITTDMQRMWGILHPAEPIDQVRLYQAEDAEKAIDIALRFHGKEQLSPRLTLSEGHRNSLGLCVFFALAKKDGRDLPLVLDDVVTSFDREHRTFVADLLLQEFATTQVLLFTHDHDWYVELRRRLPGKQWGFKVLLPWSDPAAGIRWDPAPYGLGAARALLDSNPTSAANTARSVMDVRMPVIAEQLEIPVPYIKGARNDLRGAKELLDRFQGRVGKHFRKKDAKGNHVPSDEPAVLAKAVTDWLATYGNRGSHGAYLTRPEAERLIVACEQFLSALECPDCGSALWQVTEGDGACRRCDCGALLWKLGH